MFTAAVFRVELIQSDTKFIDKRKCLCSVTLLFVSAQVLAVIRLLRKTFV